MDVIIIGAGIAGLVAADELMRAGITPTVIEARDRVGGRIFTLNDDRVGAPIELGAEFVHGRPRQIFDLAKRFGLEIKETGGNSWKLNDEGHLMPMGNEPPGSNDRLWERADSYTRDKRLDVSFERFLNMPITGGIPDREKEWARRFVAGFHAADLYKAGIYGLVKTQKADEDIGGETAHRIPQGYAALANSLYEKSEAAGAQYLFNSVVKSITWSRPTCEVLTENSNGISSTLTADRVIITVPISVLKASTEAAAYIQFLPDITEKRHSLDKIEMGSARRIMLTFDEKWWMPILEKSDSQQKTLGFLFAQDVPVSVWWTNEPSEAAMLVGWVGGEKAHELSNLTTEQFTDLAVSSLNKIFRSGETFVTGKLISSFSHNWERDPLTLGAYTYMGVGGIDAPEQLAKSLDNKLYFAGEATDVNGHWGTVHGAISSGLRVAGEIIDAA